MVSEHIFA